MNQSEPSSRPRPMAALGRLGLFALVTLVAGAVAAAMVLPVAAATGLLTRGAIDSFESLPSQLDAPDLPERSVILASDGSVMATIYYQNRVEVPLAAVSPIMRQAIVAVEDARFLEHPGIDLRGTMRAIVANSTQSGSTQGGSTITQQYVKNLLIASATNEEELEAARARTPSRKLREIRYALALERRYTKDEILERYLNIVYFGAGAYGVEAASRRYFSKPAAELDLVESATLAGIVQQPTAFDPTRNPDLAEKRRNLVLGEMAEAGFITPVQASAAARVDMEDILDPSIQPNGCTSSYAPYFCDFVIRMIKADPAFGETLVEREALLRRGGLTIRTTLDPDVQYAAMKSVTSYIPSKDPSQRAAAITLVEPGTGNVIAMAQNRDWGLKGRGKTTYNYNVDQAFGGTIGMQAGSTFKVFTLAAALEQGFSPTEGVDAPNPKTFENFVNCTDGTPFEPVTVRNSGSAGFLNMFQATAFSTNTYFVTLAERFGLCRQAEIAEEMGVRLATGDPLLRVPTFSLGTMEVTPLSMAGAYAAFANHGTYCAPRVVLEIKDRYGNGISVPDPRCREVLSRNVADAVTGVLTSVIDGPFNGRTGAAMSLPDRPAAGKTGSTNDNAAIWFAGFTPQVAAAIWVGDPRGGFAYPMTDVTINGQYYSYVTGGQIPGPIWRETMIAAHANLAPKPFELFNDWGVGPVRGVGPSPVYIPFALPKPEESKEPKP
ncbi:MAG: transglycosylase domain-containing protein [Candidatus Nanopelagicales bacterium]